MKNRIKTIFSFIAFALYLIFAAASFDEFFRELPIYLLIIFGASALFIAIIKGVINKTKKQESLIMKNYPTYTLVYGGEGKSVYIDEKENNTMVILSKTNNSNHEIINNFRAEYVVSIRNYFWIVDDTNSQILISHTKDFSINNTIFKFDNILSVEINENGTTIYQKSTTRTIAGTLVGGTMMGGSGAIVGGLSGSSKAKEKLTNLSIRLVLKQRMNPNFIMEIYKADLFLDTGIDKDDSTYTNMKNEVFNIQDSVASIIDKVDKQYEKERDDKIISLSKTSHITIYDELERLNELKSKNILSDSEFEKLKKDLLGKHSGL